MIALFYKYHLGQCTYIIIVMNIPTPAEYRLSRVPDPIVYKTHYSQEVGV